VSERLGSLPDFASELVQISRFLGAFERETVCCGTTTVSQCVVLQHLLAAPQAMTSLAAFTGMSISAMTRLVDGLERRGLVLRDRDPQDRRRVVVRLSADGAGEAERLRELTHQAIAFVLEHIPAAKQAQVLEALQLIRAAMERARLGTGRCC
jgi:DNA-binding MarR family transcriptional regulator